MRSCALFDVDGTLLRGFIIQSFPRYLANQDIIDSSFAKKIDRIIHDHNIGALDYRYAAKKIPSIYAEAIKGVDVTTVKMHAEEYMRSHVATSIHPYSRDLVDAMRQNVDMVIALSGSPTEPIQYVKTLGFHATYGSIFEARSGAYTGQISWNLIMGEEKAEYAKIIAERHGFSLKRTVGFGDSDQDAQLLQLTGLPIALNPSNALKKICDTMGWRVYTSGTINICEIVALVSEL